MLHDGEELCEGSPILRLDGDGSTLWMDGVARIINGRRPVCLCIEEAIRVLTVRACFREHLCILS